MHGTHFKSWIGYGPMSPLEVQCNSNERICCGGRHHFVKSYVEEKSGRENKQGLKTYKLSRFCFLKGGAKGEESMQLTNFTGSK